MVLTMLLAFVVAAWPSHAAHNRKLINGGSVVDQVTMNSNYPWFASLVVMDSGYPCAPSCGGAMITSGTFLSAAHCLADRYPPDPATDLSKAVLVVGFAGSYDDTQNGFPQSCTKTALETWVTSQEASARVIEVSGFKKPIHYNKVAGYDIMLVFAKANQCPTGNGPAIKMNGQCGGFDTVGSSLTLLGFGATKGEQGAASPVLKKLDETLDSVGTSDNYCNLNVPVADRYNTIACASETPATGCGTANNPTPDANGCTPGVKGAGGDSGGPWVTKDKTNGVGTHVVVQSSGQVNDAGDSYAYLINDAWFQDWIYETMKANDNCGGNQLTTGDIFVGYASADNQYCQGQGCSACTDSVVTDANCLNDVSCAIAPTVTGCVTIPTQTPLAGPSCTTGATTGAAAATGSGTIATGTGTGTSAGSTAAGATSGDSTSGASTSRASDFGCIALALVTSFLMICNI